MKNTIVICLLYFLLPDFAGAQEIQIINIQQRGDKVTLQYNLLDERLDRSYSVRLYTSMDNFIRPVENVTGDVGVDIPVGPNKTITWNAKEELGEFYSGGIKLELKGQVYVPFVELDGIEKGMTLKRGVPNDLVWFGGRGDNILSVELYQKGKLVKSFDELPNTGKASIMIPTKVKPGQDYQYRVSDSRNRDEVVFSKPFIVKRKIPLGTKITLGTVVGVGAYFLIKSLIPVTEPDIEGPPTLPAR
ncbi:MAG: hypothetical protein WBA74_17830 [Cyclobacteriaceae bacterium]